MIIFARDRVTLDGVDSTGLNASTGIFSNVGGFEANLTAVGDSGNVRISTRQLQMFDQAEIAAETAAVDGGNIALRGIELLQLSNNSLISTTAGTDRAGGNGGNIDIDAAFIVSSPNNNDIRANAFTGNGGNIRITTEGLFGIAAQPQDNPLTSDITASSQRGVQGTIEITTPEVDPRGGLSELPVQVVDASTQIRRACAGATGADTGEFVVTGRGGLPASRSMC